MLTSTFVMPWWGWVLIGAGVLIIGALKLLVFNKIGAKKKARQEEELHKDED